MDKLSCKVLKYIKAKKKGATKKSILDKYGSSAGKSLEYLTMNRYIKSGHVMSHIGADMKPIFVSNGVYSITSEGLAFLEELPGKKYDRWSTRFLAIYAAITSTAAILIEIWLHFLR